METHASFNACRFQFTTHGLTARILRQFQIVDTCHHRWQIVVWTFVEIERFAYDGQWWIVCLETAGWQTRWTGDKLQEQTLLFTSVCAHNFVQVLNGFRFRCETMVGATAFLQHFNVPSMVIVETWTAQDFFDFFRVEEAQSLRWEYRIETYKIEWEKEHEIS